MMLEMSSSLYMYAHMCTRTSNPFTYLPQQRKQSDTCKVSGCCLVHYSKLLYMIYMYFLCSTEKKKINAR